jgi:hypothetical protein
MKLFRLIRLPLLLSLTLGISLWIGGPTPADASVGPPLWHVADAAAPVPILAGARSLWCGVVGGERPGYPNCTYQLLYMDTGTHASDYSITLTMNFSAERDWDFLYLIGGGAGEADPVGNSSSIVDQVVATGSSGDIRRLVSWTGSVRSDTPGAMAIDTRSLPVSIAGCDDLQPETVRPTITISAPHRALYLVFESDELFSAEDGLWPYGNGTLVDDVWTSEGRLIYDEQAPVGDVDAFGGVVIVGSASAPLVSARALDHPIAITVSPAAPPLVGEGGTLAMFVQAADPDCSDSVNELTADLSTLPPGNDATFTPQYDPFLGKRGSLLWHTRPGDEGTYPVTFTASGNGSVTATVTIRVIRAGNVSGNVVANDCSGLITPKPLLGVTVDAFVVGTGYLAGSAPTDASGNFLIENLPEGDLTISLVTPLGYGNGPSEQVVTVASGQTATADFALTCFPSEGTPRSAGYWKHQFGVSAGGNGNASEEASSLCGYLDRIEEHFSNNALNAVVVYNPRYHFSCVTKLSIASQLLNLYGSAAPVDRARQQLLALMLNVAANYLGLEDVISRDGATVSQAITYCDHVIDNPSGDHSIANSIAEKINSGQRVNAGVIPLSTQTIAYRRGAGVLDFSVGQNPSSGPRTIRFTLDAPAHVQASVFDVSGRLVARVVDGAMEAGSHQVDWNGTATGATRLSRGIYFLRLRAGTETRVGKLIQVAP